MLSQLVHPPSLRRPRPPHPPRAKVYALITPRQSQAKLLIGLLSGLKPSLSHVPKVGSHVKCFQKGTTCSPEAWASAASAASAASQLQQLQQAEGWIIQRIQRIQQIPRSERSERGSSKCTSRCLGSQSPSRAEGNMCSCSRDGAKLKVNRVKMLVSVP